MRILVSGSTGLVGSALVKRLEHEGHQVTRLVRKKKGTSVPELEYDIQNKRLSAQALADFDAVVHLAGENIAAGRWTAKQKARIRDSRVDSTALIAGALASLDAPPKTLINASAIGYYGNRGGEELDESSPAGAGFLSDVCQAWEAAAEPARAKGIRVVNLRFGVVLSTRGGALERMLTPFKLGAGGVLGGGSQWMSWIGLDDAVRVVEFALANESIEGPINAVAPHPVTNREFTKALGRVLMRPTLFPVPAIAIKTLFGEMGEELLLGSTRVIPQRLRDAGFTFDAPEVEHCLRDLVRNKG